MIDAHDTVQSTILVFSALSAYLITETEVKRRYYGAMVGVIMGPLWFYAMWGADQWGMLTIDIVYTLSYAKGVYKCRQEMKNYDDSMTQNLRYKGKYK